MEISPLSLLVHSDSCSRPTNRHQNLLRSRPVFFGPSFFIAAVLSVVCPQIKPKKISYQFCANAGASGESACRPHKLFPLIHGDLLLPFIVGVIFHYRGVVTGYRRERGFFHSLEEMKFCFSTQFIGVFSKGMKTRLRDISSINR